MHCANSSELLMIKTKKNDNIINTKTSDLLDMVLMRT